MAIPRDTSPRGVRRSAIVGATALVVAAAWFGYCAISGEITGRVMNWERRFGEPVMRESSPAKFRENANLTWFAATGCVALAGVFFGFYRKLRDYV